MYNKIWQRERNPKNLETRYNNSLYEGGKNPKDFRSYRPVALTNILYKIFERMTNKRLVLYQENERKIDDR